VSKAIASARGFFSSIVIIFAAFKTTTSADANRGTEHITTAEMDLEIKERLNILTGSSLVYECSRIMPAALWLQSSF
jgi:hypothetical protein